MATAGSPIQNLCDEATCPICLEYFKDPVIIPECGYNFCRSCLNLFWGESENEAFCPQCREEVQQRSIRPNWQLANFAEIARKLSFERAQGKGRDCEKHQETMKLFCKDCKGPTSQRGDTFEGRELPLEEASQEHKGLICTHLESMRKEREEILAYKADVEKESQHLLRLTETERQKAKDMFRQLRQFLEEQEQFVLVQMEEVEKEIAKKREEQLARLSKELSSLERSIREMEEKRQHPAKELQQDVRVTVQRSEEREAFENPVAFHPELKRRIWDLCDIYPFLENATRQLKDTPLLRQQFQKANVTLDPDTAHPQISLSADCQRAKWEEQLQDLPSNPRRFDEHFSVLGREGFAAGRHFWEVVVGSEGMWAVGVARKSVQRKGYFSFSPEEGIWAVGKSALGYMAYDPPDYYPLFLRREPKKIQITLNYPNGNVSFFDADTGAPIYTFSGALFSGETLFPFFHLWEGKTCLRIA